MRTFVTVVSDEPKVAERLQEIFKFEKVDGKYEPHALDIINNLKGTNYEYSNETTNENWSKEVDFPSDELWEELIGPKWLYVEYEHDENPAYCNIVLRSAWYVPTAFLETLRDELQKIDEDCYIRGTYEDESYDPCGGFVYGKFEYDDIEDIDEVFDWDEYEEDDFYTENWHDQLADLEQSIVDAYHEYLQDRKDNPEDYEQLVIFIVEGGTNMGLKEKLAKKILEMKLSGTTKHMSKAIQKLQQQYDNLVNENSEEEK